MDQKQETEPTRTPCPRCSYFVELGKPDIDENLKKDYVRSLYGSQPFSWTFNVQGIKYRFQSLTRTQSRDKERVRKMVTHRAIDNKLIDDAAAALSQYDEQAAAALLAKKAEFDVAALDSTLPLLDAYYSMRTVDDAGYALPETGEWKTVEDMLTQVNARFGEMSEEAVVMLVRLSDVFHFMLDAAKEACLDETFWKGAGFVQSSGEPQKGS